MPIGQPGIRHSGPRLFWRPVVVLTACIIIAGVGLAWFMVRTVIQERTIAAQEIRDAATAAASRVAGGIVPELERIERGLRVTATENVGDGGANHGVDSVVLRLQADGTLAWPPGRLLYEPEAGRARIDEPAWPVALRTAELLEIRDRDFAAAIAAYRACLAPPPSNPALRLAVQQRLARSLRKAGRATEALDVLQQIIDAHQSDSSPAVAAAWYDRCAIIQEDHSSDNHSRSDYPQPEPGSGNAGSASAATCTVEFYAGLVGGSWRIERPLYKFYAESARRWTQPLAGRTDVARLIAREAAQLTLTAATQATLQAWRAEQHREPAGHMVVTAGVLPILAAWRTSSQGETALLVLGPRAATTQVFAPLVSRYALGHSVSIAANRVVVFPPQAGEAGLGGTTPHPSTNIAADPTATAIQDSATITVEDGPIVWRVTARPDATRDPRRRVTTRTGVYLGTLGLMLLSVALAGYFAIRTVRQELEVARLKSEFVSTVSHEFRSPLSAISHLAELLDRGRVVDEDRKREYYRLILGESGRLRRLVENLLNFARIEEGRQQFQFEPMNVGRWLRPVVDEFRAGSAAAGKEIVVEIAPDLPPVRADAGAMTTVLGNLLDNAVKYSPDAPRVWVWAGLEDGAVEIRVRDEGVGIAEADQEHIFERFYRARDAGAVAGTGLGLALVHRIVAAHGGTVDVESRAGKGSTFTVRLPALIEEKA